MCGQCGKCSPDHTCPHRQHRGFRLASRWGLGFNPNSEPPDSIDPAPLPASCHTCDASGRRPLGGQEAGSTLSTRPGRQGMLGPGSRGGGMAGRHTKVRPGVCVPYMFGRDKELSGADGACNCTPYHQQHPIPPTTHPHHQTPPPPPIASIATAPASVHRSA